MATPTKNDVKSSLHRTMRAPGGFGAMITRVPAVLEEAVATAGVVTASGPLLLASDTVAALVAYFGGWIAVIIILVILLLVITLRMIEYALRRVTGAIPGWLGGDKVSSIIGDIFSPIDSLENYVVDRLVDALTALMTALMTMLRFAIIYIMGDTSLITPASEMIHVKTLEVEYADLYRKYNYLAGQVAALSDLIDAQNYLPHPIPTPLPPYTPGTTTTTIVNTPIPATLLERITRLETHQTQLVHNQNALHADYNTLAHNETVFNSKLTAIEAALGGVRATQYGVQSTMTEFHNLINGVQHELGQLAPEVDAAVRQLLLMQPLEQLLYLGARGINNLKKLEQDMCQCPRYQRVPSDDSEALAVLGFMAHG